MRLSGELDIGSAMGKSAVHRDPSIRVIDLRDVTFIDAAGLGLLRDAMARMAPDVMIRNPPPCVERLLALAGLDDTFASASKSIDPGRRGRR